MISRIGIALVLLLAAVATSSGASRFTIVNKVTGPAADAFTIESADLRASLFVNVSSSTTARLYTSPLRLADGRTLSGALAAEVVGIAPKPDGTIEFSAGMHEIKLAATLSEIGTYRTEIVLEPLNPAGDREAFVISIERRALTLPEFFIELSTVARTDLPLSAAWNVASVKIDGTLRNTIGRPIDVAKPRISEVNEKSGAVSYALGDVTREAQLKCASPPSDTVSLQPLQVCGFEATLSGLPGAGIYEAKLTLSGATSSNAVNRTVTISVRHNWVLAALLMLLGAGAALFLRWWRGSGRTLLAQSGAAAALVERIAGMQRQALGDEARKAVDQVSLYPAKLLAALRSNNIASDKADDWLRGLRQQTEILERWLVLEDEYAALSAKDRDFVADKRREVMSIFEKPVEAENAALNTAANAYSDAVRACIAVLKLRPEIEEYALSVDTYLAWLDARGEKAAVATETDQLREAKQNVVERLNARNIKDLEAAFANARQQYRALVLKLLETRLVDPPWGVEQAAWHVHQREFNRLRASLAGTPNEKVKDRLVADFLAKHAAQLSGWLKTAIEQAASEATSDEKKNQLKALAATLPEPKATLNPDEFEAWYFDHREKERQAKGLAEARVGGAEDPGAANPGPIKGAVLDVDPRSYLLPPVETDSAGYAARAWTLEFVANVLALLFAILSGLQALWINNLAWGTASDLIIAVFWGAGIGYGLGAGIEELIRQGSQATAGRGSNAGAGQGARPM